MATPLTLFLSAELDWLGVGLGVLDEDSVDEDPVDEDSLDEVSLDKVDSTLLLVLKNINMTSRDKVMKWWWDLPWAKNRGPANGYCRLCRHGEGEESEHDDGEFHFLYDNKKRFFFCRWWVQWQWRKREKIDESIYIRQIGELDVLDAQFYFKNIS